MAEAVASDGRLKPEVTHSGVFDSTRQDPEQTSVVIDDESYEAHLKLLSLTSRYVIFADSQFIDHKALQRLVLSKYSANRADHLGLLRTLLGSGNVPPMVKVGVVGNGMMESDSPVLRSLAAKVANPRLHWSSLLPHQREELRRAIRGQIIDEESIWSVLDTVDSMWAEFARQYVRSLTPEQCEEWRFESSYYTDLVREICKDLVTSFAGDSQYEAIVPIAAGIDRYVKRRLGHRQSADRSQLITDFWLEGEDLGARRLFAKLTRELDGDFRDDLQFVFERAVHVAYNLNPPRTYGYRRLLDSAYPASVIDRLERERWLDTQAGKAEVQTRHEVGPEIPGLAAMSLDHLTWSAIARIRAEAEFDSSLHEVELQLAEVSRWRGDASALELALQELRRISIEHAKFVAAKVRDYCPQAFQSQILPVTDNRLIILGSGGGTILAKAAEMLITNVTPDQSNLLLATGEVFLVMSAAVTLPALGNWVYRGSQAGAFRNTLASMPLASVVP
jgi:hypothetical protein